MVPRPKLYGVAKSEYQFEVLSMRDSRILRRHGQPMAVEAPANHSRI